MPRVIDTLTGKSHKVKNLGWLLSHSGQVESIQISAIDPHSLASDEGKMIVLLSNGLEYNCTWASLGVCWQWLHRPVFYGVDLTWRGYKTTIRKGDNRPEGL